MSQRAGDRVHLGDGDGHLRLARQGDKHDPPGERRRRRRRAEPRPWAADHDRLSRRGQRVDRLPKHRLRRRDPQLDLGERDPHRLRLRRRGGLVERIRHLVLGQPHRRAVRLRERCRQHDRQPPCLRRRNELRGSGNRRFRPELMAAQTPSRILRFLRGNTIALLALFVALGGTTYAATALPRNSVGPQQLRKNAVSNPKLKNGAVTGAKVADNSIRGADVLESSLGQVPQAANATQAVNATTALSATTAASATNAAHATNADQLGGLPASAFQSRVTGACLNEQAIASISATGTVTCASPVRAISMTPPANVVGDVAAQNLGHGLQITTACHDAGNVLIAFQNIGSDAATLNWIWANATPTVSASGVVVGSSSEYDISFSGNRIEGQFVFANGAGNTTATPHAYAG